MKKKLAILSISLLLIMTGAAMSPSLGNISDAFNDSSKLLIKMILTIPSLMIIPSSIISGKLVEKIKKRTILIVGISIYIVGGLGGGFAKSIYSLLMFRALLGVGAGLILPLSTGLIVDFFEGEQRNKMMGYATAINNLGGVIAIVLAGLLGSINWRFAFGVYAIALVSLFLVIAYLPEQEKYKTSDHFEKSSITKNIYILMLLIAIVNVVFYAVPTNIAIILKTFKIGNALMSGFIISTLNLVAFIVGMFFNDFSNVFKKYTLTFSLFSMFLGFLILSNSSTVFQIVCSLVFVGIGIGIAFPLIFISTGKCVSRKDSTFAMALVTSSMYFGQFLSPLLINVTASYLKNDSITFPFVFSAILIAITLVIIVFKVLSQRKSPVLNK